MDVCCCSCYCCCCSWRCNLCHVSCTVADSFRFARQKTTNNSDHGQCFFFFDISRKENGFSRAKHGQTSLCCADYKIKWFQPSETWANFTVLCGLQNKITQTHISQLVTLLDFSMTFRCCCFFPLSQLQADSYFVHLTDLERNLDKKQNSSSINKTICYLVSWLVS